MFIIIEAIIAIILSPAQPHLITSQYILQHLTTLYNTLQHSNNYNNPNISKFILFCYFYLVIIVFSYFFITSMTNIHTALTAWHSVVRALGIVPRWPRATHDDDSLRRPVSALLSTSLILPRSTIMISGILFLLSFSLFLFFFLFFSDVEYHKHCRHWSSNISCYVNGVLSDVLGLHQQLPQFLLLFVSPCEFFTSSAPLSRLLFVFFFSHEKYLTQHRFLQCVSSCENGRCLSCLSFAPVGLTLLT